MHGRCINGFSENFLFGANVPFGNQNVHPTSQLWIYCKDCFTVLHNEVGQERHGNYINGFLERSLIQSNLVVWEQK